MEAAEIKKLIVGELLHRTIQLLLAGETPTSIYATYTEKWKVIDGMSPELLAELQGEQRAVIQLVWPTVRKQVLAHHGAARKAAKDAQKTPRPLPPTGGA